MRAFLLTLAMVLILSATLHAGEQFYLSRTLQLDFVIPAKITKVDAKGPGPASEEVFKHQYVLVLPPEVKLDLSIANKNPPEHHYHICITIQDLHHPADKIVGVILPDKLIQNYWLGSYRFQFTLVQRNAARQADFVTATVRLDVYGPGPK
jgi:hypothetical protein